LGCLLMPTGNAMLPGGIAGAGMDIRKSKRAKHLLRPLLSDMADS
jgi:hypothetical protein